VNQLWHYGQARHYEHFGRIAGHSAVIRLAVSRTLLTLGWPGGKILANVAVLQLMFESTDSATTERKPPGRASQTTVTIK
jgi:hypothetical protein